MFHSGRFSRTALSVACAAALAAGVAATADAQQNTQPIKVGFITSLTGAAATTGFNATAGVKLAVAEINASGGVLGRQLQLIQADDHSDPTAAVSEARRLVQQEKVDFMLGPSISQHVLAIAPIVNEAKIGEVAIAGAMAITPQVAPYHFGTYNSEAQGHAMANYIGALKDVKTLVVIMEPGSNNKAILETMRPDLSRKNIQIKSVQEYDATATDMTPQILAARRDNPDRLVLLASTGFDAGYVLKNMQDLGWSVPVIGNSTLTAQPGVVLKVSGPEGFRNLVAAQVRSLTYCSGDAVGTSEYTKLQERLKKADPDNYSKYALPLMTLAYDMVYAFKLGVEGAKKLDGPSFAAWMEQNGKGHQLVDGPLSPSKSYHFLYGESALAMAEHPEQVRSDGLMKRAGC